MPNRSKSNRRKNKKSEFIPKPKQIWRVKQPTRNWLELPLDLMVNILQRVGVIDRLENAQLVCTAWLEICKDPAMWRVIYMDRYSGGDARLTCRDMCKHAVNRSQGQLVDLTIIGFCDNELLQYIVDRSSQLRRLELVQYVHDFYEIWSEAFKKLPLLEELSLVETKIWKEDIEAAGRCCPLLKTLKLNQRALSWDCGDFDQESMFVSIQNEIALAIGKNLPELTHLELIGNSMTNIGLQAVLDGCCHLGSLDLRRCLYLDLKGDLGKRCSQQIKCLKLPKDSLEGFPYTLYVVYDSDSEDEYNEYLDDDDEYVGYSDYDDYTAYGNDDGLSEMMAFMDNDDGLSEMMAFMDMFGP